MATKNENKKKRVEICLMVVTACLVLAAVWGILAAPGTALADHKEGHKKGGGGGGGGGHELVEVPGCATFSDAGGDAVQSDGAGPYCAAEITQVTVDGEIWDYISVHPYNKRDLWFDFSNEVPFNGDVHEPPFETGFLQLGNFNSKPFDLLNPRLLFMKPGDKSLKRKMWMKLRDDASKKHYLIYFGGACGVCEGSDLITVTAGPDTDNDGFADSWTFESTGAGSLVLYEKGGKQQTRKGLFYLPFALTFVRD